MKYDYANSPRPNLVIGTDRLALEEITGRGSISRQALNERIKERRGGLNPSTLAHTLKKLQCWGLITVDRAPGIRGHLLRPTNEAAEMLAKWDAALMRLILSRGDG